MTLVHEGCGGTFQWNYDPRLDMTPDLVCDKCALHTTRGEFFGLCGCGHTEALELRAVEILTAVSYGRLEQMLSGEPDCEFELEFICHLFTEKGLLEHGVCVRQSWLTEKGKALLESYREHPMKEEK